jgi:hypothetical protein
VMQCDVIVFDLSIATNSLRWEIDTCMKLAPERTVFFTTAAAADDATSDAAWHYMVNVLVLPVSLSPRKAAATLAAQLLKQPCFAPDAQFAGTAERRSDPA